ncbi:MAG: plasmid pRiA4b ORF-3 family protein [Dehalococcoidia bacterium]
MAQSAASAPIYQLKVTLRNTRPPIWRRLQVRGNIRLSTLHVILQIAMGWTDSHLHQFIIDGLYYGEPDPDFEPRVMNEQRVRLSDVAPDRGKTFRYEYDFGDSWEHAVLVEAILDPVPRQRYPVCIDGKRACPPEDVGGVWGYAEFLAAIADPQHAEHEEMLEWSGGDFDPTAFDLAAVNQRLATLR